MSLKKKLWLAIKVSFGLILIYLLFKRIGLTDILEAISSMSHPVLYITAGLLLLTSVYVLGAMGLYILIVPPGKISMSKLFKYNSLSWAAGFLIPGADIISLSYLLKKEGIDWGPGLVINFLDKAITLAVLSAISVLAFIKFLSISQVTNLVILLAAAFAGLIFALSSNGRKIIRKFILRKYSKKFSGFSRVLKWYLLKKKKMIALNTAITLLKFITTAGLAYAIFTSMAVAVPLYDIILISATIVIIKLLPTPLKFLGLREAAGFSVAAFFYNQLGIPAAITLGAYIIVFALNYAYALIALSFADYKSVIKLPD